MQALFTPEKIFALAVVAVYLIILVRVVTGR